jgi:hypothetical protein
LILVELPITTSTLAPPSNKAKPQKRKREQKRIKKKNQDDLSTFFGRARPPNPTDQMSDKSSDWKVSLADEPAAVAAVTTQGQEGKPWAKLPQREEEEQQGGGGGPAAEEGPAKRPRGKKKLLIAGGVLLACAVVGTAVFLGVYFGGEADRTPAVQLPRCSSVVLAPPLRLALALRSLPSRARAHQNP